VAQAIQFAILGLGAGAAYTLLAQGIVLIYRGSGIVNFAHGAIAMFASFLCFLTLVEAHGWPIEAAIPVAVLAAALLGVAIQNGILRFMRATAPIVRLVATLGVLIVLQGVAGQKLWDTDFHQVDQFLPTRNYTLHEWFGFDGELGRVVVQQDRLILLGIAIALTVALWAFTRFTKIGLAISASAENERAVSALGWSPNFLATVTWAIGGATAGLAGILLAPNAGLSLTVFTIVVTVSALAVALVGGFKSFPLTLVGGIALGIAEAEVLTYSSDISEFLHDTFGIENGATGLQRALPFLVIVVVLVVRGKSLPLRSHLNERLPDLGSGVVTRWFLVAAVGALLLLNGFAFDVTWSSAVYTSLIAGVFILSIVVLTGYAGQLSLAQYAIGGLGALVASRLVADGWPAELAFLAGAVFAIVVGAVFAVPALRTRGVNLAVVTLGLGFAIEQVVFNNQSRRSAESRSSGGTSARPSIRIDSWSCVSASSCSPRSWSPTSAAPDGEGGSSQCGTTNAPPPRSGSTSSRQSSMRSPWRRPSRRSEGPSSRSRTPPSSTRASPRSNRSTPSATPSREAWGGCSARSSAGTSLLAVWVRSRWTGSISARGSSRSEGSRSS
jgi:branched-subunit amino acid ABC-type transport system permease component